MPQICIFHFIKEQGSKGTRRNFNHYCQKMICEHQISYQRVKTVNAPMNERSDTERILHQKSHVISNKKVIQSLWGEFVLSKGDWEWLTKHYPDILELKRCILLFRELFRKKNENLLKRYIERYKSGTIKPLRGFATGLENDYEAVAAAVTTNYSNGFLEGNNNKLKMTKRMMYGRAKLPVLAAKLLLPSMQI